MKYRPLPVLALTLLACAMAAARADTLEARLAAARTEAGAAPQRALAQLRTLRQQAVAAGRLDLRLAADEAACRVLSDQDSAQAVAVGLEGLAAAGPNPSGAARTAWLRLRSCAIAAQLDASDPAEPLADLEQLLAATLDPADAVPHALALLERGVHRSRSGSMEAAQLDLLAACETLKQQAGPIDRDLCLGQLASHFRRVGDLDEALALLLPLREDARRRGALYGEAIYLYSIGQIRESEERWDEAIRVFSEAAAANERLGDRTGVGYSEDGIATALLRLGRAGEALAHADRALTLLSPSADPTQHDNARITRAEALVTLGRAAEAMQSLDLVRSDVHDRGQLPLLARWLVVRALAARAQGRWQDAYTALAEARRLEQRLQAQRLSQSAARVRMQFNRARDAEELSALRRLNAQGQHLRQTQAVALVLFVALLALVGVVAARKFRQARRLQNLASTDELTGLANRRAVMAQAAQALARARREGGRMALLMIDVDHFKHINDTHGHAVGDAVLRQLARTLGQALRERDRLGRVGGEEFIAVLPDADEADARQVAERMRAAVAAAPLARPQGPLVYTVSIGVAGVRSGESIDAQIARADAALYRAKAAGRDAVNVDGTQPA